MDFEIEKFLEQLDCWIARKKNAGQFPEKLKVSKSRIELVLESVEKERTKYYYGYGAKESPFKRIACVCFAIATEMPFYDPAKASEDADADVAEINAAFALDFSAYLSSISVFDCATDIIPPFEITFPSTHFYNEMRKNLAWGNLTTPSIALIFELLLYRGKKGGLLVGRLDRSPKTVENRLPVSP